MTATMIYMTDGRGEHNHSSVLIKKIIIYDVMYGVLCYYYYYANRYYSLSKWCILLKYNRYIFDLEERKHNLRMAANKTPPPKKKKKNSTAATK